MPREFTMRIAINHWKGALNSMPIFGTPASSTGPTDLVGDYSTATAATFVTGIGLSMDGTLQILGELEPGPKRSAGTNTASAIVTVASSAKFLNRLSRQWQAVISQKLTSEQSGLLTEPSLVTISHPVASLPVMDM